EMVDVVLLRQINELQNLGGVIQREEVSVFVAVKGLNAWTEGEIEYALLCLVVWRDGQVVIVGGIDFAMRMNLDRSHMQFIQSPAVRQLGQKKNQRQPPHSFRNQMKSSAVTLDCCSQILHL